MDDRVRADLRRAAEAIDAAGALVIGAGAGMGVDSGLPDFRGPDGFWEAYPPYARLGLRFHELANPRWFKTDPTLAWGFYGHRLALYRATRPHAGFDVLRRWGEAIPAGACVITSNVDGHFQRAGFDPAQVVEVHGAIDWMQCLASCGVDPFPADSYEPVVDPTTMRAAGPLPRCPACGAPARPNILMFNDFGWDEMRAAAQERAFARWMDRLDAEAGRLVVVELGAGTAVPSVRMACEALAERHGGLLVRVNPREPWIPRGHVGLPLGALAALQALDALRRD